MAKFDVLALLPSRLQPLRRPAHSIIILDVHVRLGWAETEKILASFLPPWLTAFMRVRPYTFARRFERRWDVMNPLST